MAPRSALSPLVPSRLSCPLPSGGEGSMLCPRIRMGEGAFLKHPLTPPSPLTHRAALSPEGRGHDNDDRARGLSATGRAVGVSSSHDVKQRTFLLPAARFCARVVSSLSHPTPKPRGGRSAGRRTVFVVARVRRDARPAGRARLAALHRGGFGPGPRLPSPALPPDPVSERPRRQSCLAGEVPDLPSPRLRAAAAGRHSPLRLQEPYYGTYASKHWGSR